MDPDHERYYLERFDAHLKYLIGLVNTIGALVVVLLVIIICIMAGWLK